MHDFELEEAAAEERSRELMATFSDDMQKMRDVAAKNTGASAVCGEIVSCIEEKGGTIETSDLRKLDLKNRRIAMRLIELMCDPCRIPDKIRSG